MAPKERLRAKVCLLTREIVRSLPEPVVGWVEPVVVGEVAMPEEELEADVVILEEDPAVPESDEEVSVDDPVIEMEDAESEAVLPVLTRVVLSVAVTDATELEPAEVVVLEPRRGPSFEKPPLNPPPPPPLCAAVKIGPAIASRRPADW